MTGSVEVDIPPRGKEPYAKRADGSFKDPVAALDSKMSEVHFMVQGDVMSIPRDPDVAHGQSSLCFRDLSFSFKSSRTDGSEKVIVAPTSGAYAAGTMVAVMVRGSHFRGRGDASSAQTLPPTSPPRHTSHTLHAAPPGKRPTNIPQIPQKTSHK